MDKEKFLEKLSAEESQLDKAVEDPFAKTVDFTCSLCGLSEQCQYLGRQPKFVKGQLEFKGQRCSCLRSGSYFSQSFSSDFEYEKGPHSRGTNEYRPFPRLFQTTFFTNSHPSQGANFFK
jgi:hypothetical protein